MSHVKSSQLMTFEKFSNKKYQKSNVLIKSKFEMKLIVQKIFAWSIFNIQNNNYQIEEDQIVFYCKAKDIAKMSGHSNTGGSYYNYLQELAIDISQACLFIEDNEKKFYDKMKIFTDCRYEKKKGELKLIFNKDVLEYMDNLEKKYTLFNLEIIMKFSSGYALRIYELIKESAYPRKNEKRDSIEYPVKKNINELKFLLGLYDNSYLKKEGNKIGRVNYDVAAEKIQRITNYPNFLKYPSYEVWKDFKKAVLVRAVNEINEKTDMYVTMKFLKDGRKITDIIFICTYKKDLEAKKTTNDTVAETDNDREKSLTEKDNTLGTVDSAEAPLYKHSEKPTIKANSKPTSALDVYAKKVITKEDLDNANVCKILSIQLKLEDITKEKFLFEDVQEIEKAANGNVRMIYQKAHLMLATKKKIENKTGWMISALKNNYVNIVPAEKEHISENRSAPNENIKEFKNPFINYKQRDIEYLKEMARKVELASLRS